MPAVRVTGDRGGGGRGGRGGATDNPGHCVTSDLAGHKNSFIGGDFLGDRDLHCFAETERQSEIGKMSF